MDVIEKYASYHSTAAVKMQQYSDAFRPDTIKVCSCYIFFKNPDFKCGISFQNISSKILSHSIYSWKQNTHITTIAKILTCILKIILY